MARYKLSKVATEFNVTTSNIVKTLHDNGIDVEENNLNARIDEDAYQLLVKVFDPDRAQKSKSEDQLNSRLQEREKQRAEAEAKRAREEERKAEEEARRKERMTVKIVGHVDLDKNGNPVKPEPKP